jgi:hypothetical protein
MALCGALPWSQLCLCDRARHTARTDLLEEDPRDEPLRLALVLNLWLHEHTSTVTFILSQAPAHESPFVLQTRSDCPFVLDCGLHTMHIILGKTREVSFSPGSFKSLTTRVSEDSLRSNNRGPVCTKRARIIRLREKRMQKHPC